MYPQMLSGEPRALYARILLRQNPWLIPQFRGLADETASPPTETAATPTTTATAPDSAPQQLPVAMPRTWRRYPRLALPGRGYSGANRQPMPRAQQGAQFYDHQMAMAAEQNARRQQQPVSSAESSGIGGISWPMIALAGGGFLMLMMVMMSGKK
jgi:hypothetical protein